MTDFALALEHAPILRFDRAEPFLPSRVGYGVFRQPADSRVDYRRTLEGSAPLAFGQPGVAAVIEYGIWWDWDIQHLYELEAAWVYLGTEGQVVRVEASWHGGFHELQIDGAPPLRDGRPVLYSQPGKHAFAPSPDWFEPYDRYTRPCREEAGEMGLHVTPLFRGKLWKEDGDDARVREHLRAFAFTPRFVFDRELRIDREHLCPWAELEAWIPQRVRQIADGLRA